MKVFNNSYNEDDIKNLYENVMGDTGAYVGAYVGGTLMGGLFIETGPFTTGPAVWGATMGAQIGRVAFGYIGGCYYEIQVLLNIKKQLKDMQNDNRIHYPMQIQFPY